MQEITQEEADKIEKDNEEKIRKIINNGGKVIDTIIREKDKITTIKRIEPVNGKPTSSKIETTKDVINLQMQ